MTGPDAGSVTEWLARWNGGDRHALDELLPLVYRQLRGLARRQVRGEAAVVSPTTVVHETYLRRLPQRQIDAANREAFLNVAACVMRRVLVDQARRRKRGARGGGVVHAPFDEQLPVPLDDDEMKEVLQLDAALLRLEDLDRRAAAVVEHRLCAGLALEQTAHVLGVSAKTVQRDWTTARAWLRKESRGDQATPAARTD